MSWREFAYMLSGLNADTPLGKIVSIRAETDPEVLKGFTKEQRRIRSDYQKKLAKQKSQNEVNNALDDLKNAFIRLAGGNTNEEVKM